VKAKSHRDPIRNGRLDENALEALYSSLLTSLSPSLTPEIPLTYEARNKDSTSITLKKLKEQGIKDPFANFHLPPSSSPLEQSIALSTPSN